MTDPSKAKKPGERDRHPLRRKSAEERFAAAWQMVVEAERRRGKDPSELRMRRDIARLVRREQIEPNNG
jgi:hypothetical protein